MTLANHLAVRLTALFIVVFLIWSAIYFSMQMYEIYHDIDEGLTNLKQEFIVQANEDALFVENMEKYNPINMIVKEITFDEALNITEEHATTEVYFDTEKEFEEVRILSTAFKCESNGKYYSIKFFTSTVETDDLIENMLTLLIILWLTLSALIFIAGRRIIQKSSRPFYTLLNRLNDFSLDHSKMIELPTTNISEFKALNSAVDSLLKENIQTYNEQKTFIENASHELQTPLAIVIGKIELMMNSSNSTEKEIKELSSILGSLNRMRRLNSSLLLLSKIKNKQFVESSNVDIAKVVRSVCDSFGDIIEHKKLKLDICCDESPTVHMNEDLAYIMISNLVKNAVNYNLPEGTISIKLTENSFVISNDGKPIPEGVNIFNRYESNTPSNASTGLGLSIVLSIARGYRFRVEYAYETQHIISIYF